MSKPVDGTQLYHDAIKRIGELERLNGVLAAEIDLMRPIIIAARAYTVQFKDGMTPRALQRLSIAVNAYEAAREGEDGPS